MITLILTIVATLLMTISLVWDYKTQAQSRINPAIDRLFAGGLVLIFVAVLFYIF